MSLLYRSNKKADLKRTDYTDRTDYGFILALVCMALALVVASAIFKPAPVGTGIEVTGAPSTPDPKIECGLGWPTFSASCSNESFRVGP